METYLILIILIGIGVVIGRVWAFVGLRQELRAVNASLIQIAYMIDHWDATRKREKEEAAEAEDDDFDDEETGK